MLAWAAAAAGEAVVSYRRLSGGTATATHLLTLRSGRELVLRRHDPRWVEREPDLVHREAATLGHIAGRGLPVPTLVAVDVDGSATATARPAMLLSRLPGRIDLSPRDSGGWLQQMAETLAAIHDQPPVPDGSGFEPQPALLPATIAARPVPEWSRHPAAWRAAVELLWEQQPEPTPPEVATLVHGDYQHFNLLWARGRLSGVVDWSGAPAAPLDSDLGHCRLNLVILYGSEFADGFLRRYEEVTGRTVDPWWDLFETAIFLPTWAPTIRRQVGARIPLDVDAMHRRVDDHLPAVLRRAQSTIDG